MLLFLSLLRAPLAPAAELLHHRVDLVPVLEAQARRGLGLVDARAVEDEAGRVGLDWEIFFFFLRKRSRRSKVSERRAAGESERERCRDRLEASKRKRTRARVPRLLRNSSFLRSAPPTGLFTQWSRPLRESRAASDARRRRKEAANDGRRTTNDDEILQSLSLSSNYSLFMRSQ